MSLRLAPSPHRATPTGVGYRAAPAGPPGGPPRRPPAPPPVAHAAARRQARAVPDGLWVDAFTGARGVAALVVVVHHLLLTQPALADAYFHRTSAATGGVAWWSTVTPLYLAWAGKEAVLLFFVLSGVVLTLSVMPAGTTAPRIKLREFYPRRLTRLYLPVWASIVLAWGCAVVVPRDWSGPGTSWWLVEENPAPDLAGTVQDALLLVGSPGTTNHVLWSLQWEVLFCLLLPLALPALRAASRWWAAKGAAALAVFGLALDHDSLTGTALSVFALGTLMALEAPRLAGWAARLDRRGRPAAAWVAVLLTAVVLLLSYRLVALVPAPVLHVPAVTRVLQVVGACVLIFVAWYWSGARRVLTTPVLQWLGSRSYSLYLVHLPIMVTVAAAADGRPDLAVVAVWSVPLTLAVTELFYRAVERPSHRLARQLGRRRNQAQSSVRTAAGARTAPPRLIPTHDPVAASAAPFGAAFAADFLTVDATVADVRIREQLTSRRGLSLRLNPRRRSRVFDQEACEEGGAEDVPPVPTSPVSGHALLDWRVVPLPGQWGARDVGVRGLGSAAPVLVSPATLGRAPGRYWRCDPWLVGLAVGVLGATAVLLVAAPAALLPAWWVGVAIAVRLASGGQYAWSVARKKARPNIVTWVLWGATPMIATAAQLGERPGPEVAVTFVLGLSPLVVAGVALVVDRSAFTLTPFTACCGAAAVVGIVLWQLTENPDLAIALCILADLLATLPTLRKAYADPASEYAPPYLLSMVAMLITLGTVADRDFTSCAFPVYMLLVNALLFTFAALPVARLVTGVAPGRAPRPAAAVSPTAPRAGGSPRVCALRPRSLRTEGRVGRRTAGARQEQLTRIRAPRLTPTTVGVVSLEGGSGQTTVAALLGLTLAEYGSDRVVALDGHPPAGTLAERLLSQRPAATVGDLVRHADRVRSITDLAALIGRVGRLDVVASAPALLSTDDYDRVLQLLRRFYHVVVADLGAEVAHPAAVSALTGSDSLVVVGSLSFHGARRLRATLDWLDAHGYHQLVRGAVVALSAHPRGHLVDQIEVHRYFAARCRAVVDVPRDAHLAADGRVELTQLAESVLSAAIALSSHIADTQQLLHVPNMSKSVAGRGYPFATARASSSDASNATPRSRTCRSGCARC